MDKKKVLHARLHHFNIVKFPVNWHNCNQNNAFCNEFLAPHFTFFLHYVQCWMLLLLRIALRSTFHLAQLCVWFLFLFSFCHRMYNPVRLRPFRMTMLFINFICGIFHSVTLFYSFTFTRTVTSMCILYILMRWTYLRRFSYQLYVNMNFVVHSRSFRRNTLVIVVGGIYFYHKHFCMSHIKLSSKTCQRHPMFSLHIQ